MSFITEGSYQFDEFQLDPSRRLLTRDGERIPVSPRSFEVLLYLVRHAGKVVLKDELLKGVWPDAFVEESNLTQHIFWLRKAFKDRAGCIATIPGRGYEFTAQVRLDVPPEFLASAVPVESTSPYSEQVHLHLNTKTTRVTFKQTEVTASRLPARGKRAIGLRGLVAVFGVAFAAATVWVFWNGQHRVVPGDHHEVVLADFSNATPDRGFDGTLRTLLAIDLSQSPYLLVASESQVHETLNLMGRPPDTPMTTSVSLEVCQRLNDQVVLSGQIASFGEQYVVSLSAINCQNGEALVQSKVTAGNREAVIGAIEKVSTTVRRRLGESLPLQAPAHPLQPVHTVSMDALRSYSQAMDMQNHEREAIPLFRRAVELDPQFAWGYAQLAGAYGLQGEFALQKQYLLKAYSMRDQLNDYQRFSVINDYNSLIDEDAQKQLLNLQSWSALYPNQAVPLQRIADVLKTQGRFEDAIAPARRALALQPNEVGPYITLASSLAESGHPAEAKAVCEQAFRKNIDSIFLHLIVYGIAIHQHDQAGIAAEDAWASTKDDGVAFPAWRLLGEGKAHEAVTRVLQSVGDLRRQGFVEHADRRFRLLLRRESMVEMNAQLYEQMKSIDLNKYPDDLVFAVAEVGRIKDAQMELRLLYGAPTKQSSAEAVATCSEDRAAVALAVHKPEEAIADLEPCRKSGMAAPEGFLMLGQAYLDAGKPQLAEAAFRYVLDHSFAGLGLWESIARLGLARALSRKGDVINGRRAYETVLAQWRDADPDFPLLLDAKREFEQINLRVQN